MCFGCYHCLPLFLEQRDNRINLLVRFMKHRQLVRQVGDSRALSFVEKEAMAPHTTGELDGGMAHRGHIRRKKYEFIGVEGPAPPFIVGHVRVLRSGDSDPMASGEQAHETAPSGCI